MNRLSTTTQIFTAIKYLILISEKYLHFRKKTKAFGKDISFPPRRGNWIQELWKSFWDYVYLKDMYKSLKGIGIIQVVSKLTIFVNL